MKLLDRAKNKLRRVVNDFSCNIINSAVDAGRFEFGYDDYSRIHISNSFETIVKILNGSYSFARYGDGEFNIMFGNSIEFQVHSKQLEERLCSIISTCDDKFLVGIPKFYFYPDLKLRYEQRKFVRGWVRENRKRILMLLNPTYLYYDTCATQLYALRDNDHLDEYYHLMRKIWHGKSVLIVCGKNSFKTISPALVDNASDVFYVFGPSKNAFEIYDVLFSEVLSYKKDTVVLISLGPTATVMAYDLYKLGYQAIDIGHAFKDYYKFIGKETMDSSSIANYYKAD